jgi:hypothetical protein
VNTRTSYRAHEALDAVGLYVAGLRSSIEELNGWLSDPEMTANVLNREAAGQELSARLVELDVIITQMKEIMQVKK